MIVVLGRPALGRTADGSEPLPAGRAGAIAVAIAAAGARVELVGSVGDDAAGDQVAVALGRAGVGHAALLARPIGGHAGGRCGGRVAAPSDVAEAPRLDRLPRLEAADVELGLRYLSECRVLVVADALVRRGRRRRRGGRRVPRSGAGRRWCQRGEAVPAAFVDVATVLEDDGADAEDADAEDADAAAFTGLVAGFAVALDAGRAPLDAFSAALRSASWEPAAE